MSPCSRSPPHFRVHQTSPRRACAHQLLGSGLYFLVEELVEPLQTKGRQTYFKNCFLCSRVLVANEFLEQSLHFSSPAHLGCLALEAAALPSSFPTQQFCHPAATTPQLELSLLQTAHMDLCLDHTGQQLSLQHQNSYSS